MGIYSDKMVDTFTKSDLAQEISCKTGIAKAFSEDIVSSILDHIIEIVETDGKLVIPQFGTFSLQKKKVRMGRNPKTKEEFEIPARTKIAFSPSPIFKEYING
jgi:integration host factor subunit alpha